MKTDRLLQGAAASKHLSVAWISDLGSIQPSAWNALAKPLASPFLEWDWLRTLELSKSTGVETGWLPHHLTVWSGSRLVAAAPLYIKGHSAGEFVFDHVWADVAERLNITYYPKLVGMSPFTPMIGYRFLMAPDVNEPEVTQIMIAAIQRLCREVGLFGVSFLFVDPDWGRRMLNYGFQPWQHLSFRWSNHHFRRFDDYLGRFNANQRRNIKRERLALRQQGISMKVFTGADIPDEFIPRMYSYYERTNEKFGPWGCRYLTREFFKMVGHQFSDRLVVVAAIKDGDLRAPVGMSFLVRKAERLYGRYWGSRQEYPMLHFNACYYTPIEWAIDNGIRYFDPGAGGAHKVRRGFEATANHSLHRFADERLQLLMTQHIGAINRQEAEQIENLNRQLPFAKR